jgi:GT2 family glycosyltransferase
MNGAENASAAPLVSVAICTRDRPERLRRALASLLGQTMPPAEILVVDNAPASERTRELVAAEFPRARHVQEPVPGLDFARNRALREAHHEIVAFIDDDAVADPGWTAALAAAFARDPEVGVCTGRIDALELATPAQRLLEANGGLFAGGERRLRVAGRGNGARFALPTVARAIGLGSGCNLAVRRELALALGGFDEALDLGEELPGGGDNDMVWRVLESGAAVVYEPAARVRHEHRRDLAAAGDQISGHHRGMVALLSKAALSTRGSRRLPTLAFLAWRLAKPGVRLLRRARGRDPLPAALLLRVWANCWLGLLAYPRAVRIAARRRARGG